MAQDNVSDMIDELVSVYGEGLEGTAPNAKQWAKIFNRGPARPITLVNFFKLRDTAKYPEGSALSGTGKEAFDRYAAVSIPAVARAGGKFLVVAPCEGNFVGNDEDWDIIAVGAFPETKVFLSLWSDTEYQKCFFHRTAACEKQKVFIADC